MEWKRLAIVGTAAGLALGVGGCADGYGYSGLSAGYGDGYYSGGYGDGYYGDPYYGGYYGDPYYGGGYGSYFGWYGDYYYPGTGIYVYDRYRRPHRWNDRQRDYWQGRRGDGRGRDNWGGFDRDRSGQGYYRGRNGGYQGTYRQNRTYQGGYPQYRSGDRPQYRTGERYQYRSQPNATAPQPGAGYTGRNWQGGRPDAGMRGRGAARIERRQPDQQ